MKNSFKLHNKQKGMTILVAMMTLVVLMLLGIGAMVASNTMFKLAGNLQYENEAKNRAESALIKGETWLKTGTNAAAASYTNTGPYFLSTAPLSPVTSWPSGAPAPAGGEQFIIQRLTTSKVTPPGYSICFPSCGSSTPPSYDIYRVIAQGTSSRGAKRYVESIMQIP